MTHGFLRFHGAASPLPSGDWPGSEFCVQGTVSEVAHDFADRLCHLAAGVGFMTGKYADFPRVLGIWNLTVNLLMCFPLQTFTWCFGAVSLCSLRLDSSDINKMTVVFGRASSPASAFPF